MRTRLNTSLDTLQPFFRMVAVELIAKLVEAKIPHQIINTRRTQKQADWLRANGRSWTKKSRHIKGEAIDLCPFEIWQWNGPDKLNWDAKDPVWETMAAIAERIGLRCGYRWKNPDCGHYEWPTLLS